MRGGSGAKAARLVDGPEEVIGLGVLGVFLRRHAELLFAPVQPLRIVEIGLGEDETPAAAQSTRQGVHVALQSLDHLPELAFAQELFAPREGSPRRSM